MRIVKSVLWSAVLYVAESWTMTQADRKRFRSHGNVDVDKDAET